ncbi:MAG TPA: hypothetical protein VLT33_02410 [Labilithrix sp.]|nr:hypothetical protein [Labilithrix sp.]
MNDEANTSACAPFDVTEESWFARPERTTRPSQRPTLPAPAVAAPIDDSIADGWFIDVGEDR